MSVHVRRNMHEDDISSSMFLDDNSMGMDNGIGLDDGFGLNHGSNIDNGFDFNNDL
jgi:hypothetical protein